MSGEVCYKSPTGLQKPGCSNSTVCPIRLKELNNAKKPAPTNLKGAQVARENYIRRRVASVKNGNTCFNTKKNPNCDAKYAYGPVFGIKKNPRNGNCSNIYSANGGSGSDIVQWKRIYGGSRILFSNNNCSFGCEGKISS